MLASLVIALSSAQEARPDTPSPSADRPNIVLVTIDTLGREHLGCYGYPRPTSPRVDALAGQSVLFENAYAPMATTFPSHVSMLTGLYPHQHGRTSNRAGVLDPFVSAQGRMLVASALSSAGYRTAGFVSSSVLHQGTGIAQGFESYDGPKGRHAKRPARETTSRALAWLATVPAGEPFFLWVHLWDVHEPNTVSYTHLTLPTILRV